MKCHHCQADIPDNAKFCMYCGNIVAEQELSDQPEDMSEETMESIEDIPTTMDPPISPEAESQIIPIETFTATEPPAKKKNLKITLISVSAVIVLAVVGVFIYLLGADGRTVDEAQSQFYSGNYMEALNLLDTIDNPSGDTSRDIHNLKDEIYAAAEEDINKLIEDGKSSDALELLNTYAFLPSYNDLQSNIYKSVETAVFSLMDQGEYIEAQALLEKNNFITNYDSLARQIKFETLILQCVFNLRPLMKNPSSLQINEVEIYDIKTEYPAFVFSQSGQNGFGGYSSSYVAFSSSDLDYIGSCKSIYDPDEDDVVERLIALLIKGYRDKSETIEAPYDLARINSFIPSGKKPNINFEQYKDIPTSDA